MKEKEEEEADDDSEGFQGSHDPKVRVNLPELQASILGLTDLLVTMNLLHCISFFVL